MSRRDRLLVATVAALATLPWLAAYRPLTTHEAYVARTAWEMRASGDWLVPRFLGDVRLKKPPLAYWAAAVAQAAYGQPAAARLPSALAGIACALVVAWLAAGMYGPRTGTTAGLLYATGVFFVTQFRLAEADALLTLFVTLAMAAAWGAGGSAGRAVRRPPSEVRGARLDARRLAHAVPFLRKKVTGGRTGDPATAAARPQEDPSPRPSPQGREGRTESKSSLWDEVTGGRMGVPVLRSAGRNPGPLPVGEGTRQQGVPAVRATSGRAGRRAVGTTAASLRAANPSLTLRALIAAKGLRQRLSTCRRETFDASRSDGCRSAAFWLALAAAILAKGPVALLFVATLGFTAVGRRCARHVLRPLPTAAFVLATLAWPVTVAWQRPEAWHVWWGESVGRFGADPNGVSRYPGYYLVAALWLTLPWTPLWLLALRDRWRHGLTAADRFLLAWGAGGALLLSCSSGKQEHYLVPALAPLVILAATRLSGCWNRATQPDGATQPVGATQRVMPAAQRVIPALAGIQGQKRHPVHSERSPERTTGAVEGRPWPLSAGLFPFGSPVPTAPVRGTPAQQPAPDDARPRRRRAWLAVAAFALWLAVVVLAHGTVLPARHGRAGARDWTVRTVSQLPTDAPVLVLGHSSLWLAPYADRPLQWAGSLERFDADHAGAACRILTTAAVAADLRRRGGVVAERACPADPTMKPGRLPVLVAWRPPDAGGP